MSHPFLRQPQFLNKFIPSLSLTSSSCPDPTSSDKEYDLSLVVTKTPIDIDGQDQTADNPGDADATGDTSAHTEQHFEVYELPCDDEVYVYSYSFFSL